MPSIWEEKFQKETGKWWSEAKERQARQEAEASTAHAKCAEMLASGRKKCFDELFFERLMTFARDHESLKELGQRVGLPGPVTNYNLETLKMAQSDRRPITGEMVALCAVALYTTCDFLLTGLSPDENLIAAIEKLSVDPDADVNQLLGLHPDFRPDRSELKMNPFFKRKERQEAKRRAEAEAATSENQGNEQGD